MTSAMAAPSRPQGAPAIPDDPGEIGPRWFNELFEAKGETTRVATVVGKRIGTGQVGMNIRFALTYDRLTYDRLTYDRAGPAAPPSVVGKFHTADPQSRQTAGLLGVYRREYQVYTTFTRAVSRLSPAILHADYDDERDCLALIMEDMAPAVQGDQLLGCDVAAAEQALAAAAVLHASYWGDTSLDTYPWLDFTSTAPPSPIPAEMMPALWLGFKERHGSRITPGAVEVGNRLAAHVEFWARNDPAPRCLSHADFRLDNLLFGHHRLPLAVVDWQTAGYRGAALDVAYFIGAGLTEDVRRRHEGALLRFYHERLQAEGVTDYRLDDLRRDYAWHSFAGVNMAFAAGMLVDRTDRGDAMFLAMLNRHADQVLANDALDLLPAGSL